MQSASAAFYDAIVLQYLSNTAEEAFTVKQEAELLSIFAVQPGFHCDFQFIAAIDLRPTSEARPDIIGAILIPLRNQVVLIPQSWPGANNAHLPGENTQNLGQLVNRQATEPNAGTGDPLLGIGEQMGWHVGRSTGVHGSEFWHHKGLLLNADPLLPEQHRTRRVQFHNECKDQHGNGQENQSHKR